MSHRDNKTGFIQGDKRRYAKALRKKPTDPFKKIAKGPESLGQNGQRAGSNRKRGQRVKRVPDHTGSWHLVLSLHVKIDREKWRK